MAISLTSTSTSGAFVVNGQNVVQADSNGNVSIRTNNTVQTPESFIKENLNATGSAPIFAARAWVNFDGTTETPSTIRGSGNVSSVTRNSTGKYTVNFTTAMSDENYSTVLGGKPADNDTTQTGYRHSSLQTTTSVQLQTVGGGGSATNSSIVTVAVFR